MFLEILSTLLRVLFVFSVLIIAFGLSFHILLQHLGKDEKGFYSLPISMVRVSTMMLGEIDFLNTFLGPMRVMAAKNDIGLWNQTAAAIWFLLVFAILMPILLMNLLIGLAVGDIETVRRNASMKRLAMQIEHHTDLERRLPKQILNCVRRIEVYEYPNKRNNCATTFIVSYNILKYISCQVHFEVVLFGVCTYLSFLLEYLPSVVTASKDFCQLESRQTPIGSLFRILSRKEWKRNDFRRLSNRDKQCDD